LNDRVTIRPWYARQQSAKGRLLRRNKLRA